MLVEMKNATLEVTWHSLTKGGDLTATLRLSDDDSDFEVLLPHVSAVELTRDDIIDNESIEAFARKECALRDDVDVKLVIVDDEA